MKERKNLYLGISGWAILLASAMSFTSCADDDIIDSSQLTTGKGICFNIANDNEAWQPDSRTSKAESTTTFHSENPDDGFSITATTTNGIRSFVNTKPQSRGTQTKEPGNDWSYKVGAYYYTNANAAPTDFFSENTSGGLTFGSAGVGTSSYYWPQNGNISFFAVAPAIENFNVPTAENIDAPTLTYTIPSDVSQQKDIMVAQTAAINTPTAPVGLQFQHLLAAVQFKVGTMQFIKINSLKVVGVRGGTISFTNNNGVWTPSLNAATTTEYDLSSLITDTSGLTTGDEITSNDNSSIMLIAPQTLPEGAKIVVNYTETITDLTYTKEATLSGEWVAGKTTTYALNISGTDFGTVEIPRPEDQDAHYIMLPMSYKMGNILNHEKIESVRATAQWLEDENGNDNSGNNSTKSGISLKFKGELSETQKQGFWTDKRYIETITVSSTGSSSTTGLLLDTTKDSHNNTGLRGGSFLNITSANGDIVLFIEENNGITDRVGELIFTAKLKNSDVQIILGRGQFKQLCPSWKNKIGIERIESDAKTYAYGFDYTRKVVYTNPGDSWWILKNLGRALYTWGASSVITDDEGSFIELETGSFDVLGFTINYTNKVILDYGALSKVEDVADSDDGLINTRALYNFTGGVDIAQVETEFDENLGWSKSTPIQGEGTPEDYAAFIALSRNRMYEKKTIVNSSEGTTTTYKATLYKNGKTDLEGDDIIEWYLPSSVEAENLNETGKNSDGSSSSVIDNLDGTYWSSTAGSDMTPTKSYTFNYKNNVYQSGEETNRTAKHKVRAVRKKP